VFSSKAFLYTSFFQLYLVVLTLVKLDYIVLLGCVVNEIKHTETGVGTVG